jgi:hypothetical protein
MRPIIRKAIPKKTITAVVLIKTVYPADSRTAIKIPLGL